MKKDLAIHPVLFLDDWPAPPDARESSAGQQQQQVIGGDKEKPEEQAEEEQDFGIDGIRLWRIQTLLAVNPWGIPVMGFKEAYERMFVGKTFDPQAHGYETIGAMVFDLPHIFAVQEPDDVTALLFPDYPNDIILHDARIGHEFPSTRDTSAPSGGGGSSNGDAPKTCDSTATTTTTTTSTTTGGAPTQTGATAAAAAATTGGPDVQLQMAHRWTEGGLPNGAQAIDADLLIAYAWIQRDTEFPDDVVLAGEQYTDMILPMASANIPNTRGVHQALIVGVANPGHFFINVKSEFTPRVERLTGEIYDYFERRKPTMDAYRVPDEFIYPGFPCLVYIREFGYWERCAIVSRSVKSNRILVETVDFGGIYTVNRMYLYLMPRRFLDLPKQAILCSLMGVCPKPKAPDDKWPDKWSRTISIRMRCFSQPSYWLDALLVEPEVKVEIATTIEDKSADADHHGSDDIFASMAATSAATVNAQVEQEEAEEQQQQRQPGQTEQGQHEPARQKRLKRVLKRSLDFETVICDRHDEFGKLDFFLDEILVMETYGLSDMRISDELNRLKESFREALVTLPRPDNPFKTVGNKSWTEEAEKPAEELASH